MRDGQDTFIPTMNMQVACKNNRLNPIFLPAQICQVYKGISAIAQKVQHLSPAKILTDERVVWVVLGWISQYMEMLTLNYHQNILPSYLCSMIPHIWILYGAILAKYAICLSVYLTKCVWSDAKHRSVLMVNMFQVLGLYLFSNSFLFCPPLLPFLLTFYFYKVTVDWR